MSILDTHLHLRERACSSTTEVIEEVGRDGRDVGEGHDPADVLSPGREGLTLVFCAREAQHSVREDTLSTKYVHLQCYISKQKKMLAGIVG